MSNPRKDGVYRHFRGKLYTCVAIAIDAETDSEEALVVYRCVVSGRVYVRSITSWASEPMVDGSPTGKERFEELT